eukprot:8941-Chlamydomonas_euryale.AAC.2
MDDGWMNRRTDGWTDGWMDGWTDGWKDGWMEGWKNGWTDGWMHPDVLGLLVDVGSWGSGPVSARPMGSSLAMTSTCEQRQLSSAARHNKPSKRSQTDKTSQNRKTQRTKPSQQDTSNTNNPSKQSQTNKTPQIRRIPANKAKPTRHLKYKQTQRTNRNQQDTSPGGHLTNGSPKRPPTSTTARLGNSPPHSMPRNSTPTTTDTDCHKTGTPTAAVNVPQTGTDW